MTIKDRLEALGAELKKIANTDVASLFHLHGVSNDILVELHNDVEQFKSDTATKLQNLKAEITADLKADYEASLSTITTGLETLTAAVSKLQTAAAGGVVSTAEQSAAAAGAIAAAAPAAGSQGAVEPAPGTAAATDTSIDTSKTAA
jgi:galactokinase/mevalonate kinase-like predicted kinase